MQTPWGKSDSIVKIERGVSWVETPSHGGLAITATRAMQTLSSKAITIAMRERYGTEFVNLPKNAYLFFEEDCAYAMAFYEHPEWKRALEVLELKSLQDQGLIGDGACPEYVAMKDRLVRSITNTNDDTKAEMAEIIQRYFPEYFYS